VFEKLVYIGAISKYESSNVHLVAVTSAGVFKFMLQLLQFVVDLWYNMLCC